MTSSRRATLSGLGSIAIAGLIWGTIPLVLRAADGASVVKVFYRVFFAAIAIAIWMAATGQLGEIRALPRKKLLQVAVQGVILTVNWVLFLTALDLTNVATAELLGAGLAFASALTYAALLLRSKKLLRGISGGSLMLVEYVVASVLLLPFVLWAYGHGQGPTSFKAYSALLTLGLVQTAFAGVLFLGGLRRVRTDSAAILTYTEPASAVVFAALFLAEPLTLWTVVGGALVVAGGLVVTRLEPAGVAESVPIEAAGTEPEGP